MSEEIKTPDGIPLPHTTDFEDNGPGKNSTKIEVDMEKNAPFIKEVKARLDAANDPEVAKKIEEEFLAATGIPFEKAYEAMENKVTVIVDKADGSTEIKKVDKDSEEAKTGKIVEPLKEEPKKEPVETEQEEDSNSPAPKTIIREKKETIEEVDTKPAEDDKKSEADRLADASDAEEVDDEDELDAKTLAEVEARLAEAKENPESLKFTETEISELIKMGILGNADAVRALADRFNQEIDELIKSKSDSTSEFADPEKYDKAIRANLEIKISLQQSIESAKELTDPVFIQELFNARYPGYAEKGPAIIYELFFDYLKFRTKPDQKEFLFRELTDKSKINNIRDQANKKVFRHMMTSTGAPFTHMSLINTMYELNKKYIGKSMNLDLADMDAKSPLEGRKKASAPVALFSLLFMRFLYKKLVPDFEHSKLQRKYFVGFIIDSANQATLTPEKVKALDDVCTELWDYIVQLDIELARYEHDHFDKDGHRIKK